MLGNTDVSRSRALKQALLSEARQGGEKPRGGKASAGKGQSRPAKGAPFGAGGQDPLPGSRRQAGQRETEEGQAGEQARQAEQTPQGTAKPPPAAVKPRSSHE